MCPTVQPRKLKFTDKMLPLVERAPRGTKANTQACLATQ